jgi:pimeloyl-ACP methyl ester carboxylesterase
MQKSIFFKNANVFFTDEGKGTAVVMVHGFLENKEMWTALTPSFLKRNRVITIDLLGHGKSDCVGYVHSMELFAESIQAVLTHLRIRKCILVGHSLGGYVSLAFAEKYPTKIKGLCLLNSTSYADNEERKAIRERANKMVQKNFTNMVRMSFVNLFGVESKTTFKDQIDIALSQALQTPIQGYIAANEGMRIRPKRTHVLQNNSFKKCIITGKEDPILDYSISLQEAKESNTEIQLLEGGHMSHIENKAPLKKALQAFFKSCS